MYNKKLFIVLNTNKKPNQPPNDSKTGQNRSLGNNKSLYHQIKKVFRFSREGRCIHQLKKQQISNTHFILKRLFLKTGRGGSWKYSQPS